MLSGMLAQSHHLSTWQHPKPAVKQASHSPIPAVRAGVAGGATRAALTQHFALGGNAADVSAKEGSQVGLLAVHTAWQCNRHGSLAPDAPAWALNLCRQSFSAA